MSKRSGILAALAVAFSAACAFAVEPSVTMKYDGADVDLSVVKSTNDQDQEVWSFLTPDKKVAVDVTLTTYPDYPAFTRMSTRVRNTQTDAPTGVVSDLRVFTETRTLPSADAKLTINGLIGSPCQPIDFQPEVRVLAPQESTEFSTPGGRSSSEFSPYIEANVDEKTGVLYCVGWTGNWRAYFVNNGGSYSVELGMTRTGFRLNGRESLLQPSILVVERNNVDRRSFKTAVHRFMVYKNSPSLETGSPQGGDVCLTAGGGNKTPEMMLKILKYGLENKIPFDVFWVDAGWYGAPHEADPYPNCGPEWWQYVGDWRVNTTTHPTGDLLPIANACHEANKKFLLWFEPERIHESSPIFTAEPFCNQHGLCYYGDPRSFDWIQKTIYSIIEKHHVDVYRQDFNMDPTGAWTAIENAEGPDRVGVAEAKHIEGLYRFLDEMRERFPWIEQENCASGGRRIDIEMVSRAHSYCRSDYYIGPKPGDTCFNLGQNMTLNLTPYLPFQGGETNCVADFDEYGFMSVASSATVFTPTDLDGGIVRRDFTPEQTAWYQKMMGWANRLKPYYLGDFYQLTDETYATDDCWCAWATHRAGADAGFVIAFRRAAAQESSMTFHLPAIEADAKYRVEYYDGTVKENVSGAELKDLVVELENPRSFQLILYQKL